MELRPNFLIVITDQQRAPRHWPDEPGWLDALMPADAELRRTGLTFTEAICNTCMCTPSRATLFTGLMPAEHGCTLTLTAGGAVYCWPKGQRPSQVANLPAVTSISAGYFASACGVTSDGVAYCWDSNMAATRVVGQ